MRCFAHELRLPTCSVLARTSRGQATSGCYGGSYEAPRTLKAWGKMGTVTNRTAVGGGMDCCGIFFFFLQKIIFQSELFMKQDTTMVMMVGDVDDGDWMVYEMLAVKNIFGHLAPKILHLPE